MDCPNCGKEIPPTLITSEAGRLGGKKSKREITPDQQKKMYEGRWGKKKKEKE